MKQKSGQIELTFNWIYILVAGAVILLFVIGGILTKKPVTVPDNWNTFTDTFGNALIRLTKSSALNFLLPDSLLLGLLEVRRLRLINFGASSCQI